MIRASSFRIETTKRIEVINITPEVREFVRQSGIGAGLCSVNIKHTSAGIVIQEDERLLREDIENYF
ncbi:MAG: YjbQ family protein, partial [Deltaproteobacteria bacterium]|nr:YjbQ family protein [Deltaproteobacteria bacterium]